VTIAITGASGALGRATAQAVLSTIDPRDVVLTTRHPDQLEDLAALGALVRRADFTDPLSLDAAFTGVDRLLLVSTEAGAMRLDQHRAAIAAALRAGVGHVVYTSIPEPTPENPGSVVPDHAATEQALRTSGMRWTMLRNNLYTHMQIPVVEQAAASGRLVTNTGTAGTAYVTREDCAAVAAAVLTGSGHEAAIYDITGNAAIRATDLATLAAELGDHEVDIVPVDDASFAGGLRDAGMPADTVELVTTLGAAGRGGFLAGVSTAVADLTGRAPTGFQDAVRGAHHVD